jgi:hypothetical protein
MNKDLDTKSNEKEDLRCPCPEDVLNPSSSPEK